MVAAGLLAGTAASAQQRQTPYWASIKTEKLNMRVGPSRDYRIEWVYKRKGLPIKVVRISEGWRLIRDVDGAQGWVTSSLLSAQQTALVVGNGHAAMRETPARGGRLKWNLEPGVIGSLGKCEAGWCQLDIRGHIGWVEQSRLWGTGKP